MGRGLAYALDLVMQPCRWDYDRKRASTVDYSIATCTQVTMGTHEPSTHSNTCDLPRTAGRKKPRWATLRKDRAVEKIGRMGICLCGLCHRRGGVLASTLRNSTTLYLDGLCFASCRGTAFPVTGCCFFTGETLHY